MICARAFSANGVALGNEFQVSTTGLGFYPEPSVTALSNGGFAVAFSTENEEIAVQAFGASLERVGSEMIISTPENAPLYDPVIVAMQGRYAVFFKEMNNTDFAGNTDAVRGWILGNDGTVVTKAVELPASGSPGTINDPAAAILTGNRTAIAWGEEVRDAQGDYIYSIKAQILNADGSKLGNEIIVMSGKADDYVTKPAITQLADGGFSISYFFDGKGSNSDDLYLATFNSSGVRTQADLLVERVYPMGDEYSASLATLEDGRVAVSWTNKVSAFDNNDNGLHAQIVDPRQKAISLNGSSFNDHYVGTRFNDRLKGAAGDDRLEGGKGKDTFTGGTGKDTFVFRDEASRANKDKIIDFKTRDDSIWLDNSVFTKLGSRGTDASPSQLRKAFFTVGVKAKDKNDYLVYDKNKGVLYYDADGSGKGKAVEIATLSNKASLTEKDFFII